ncbi:tRNA (adenine(22)-N(1))-methyltransferase [Colwellia psychrerythraea]|uniref:SAM-dependent methyltransferase n=1 Tax=Colwellia psychrerythraea TaxID=28229 RepID=A0A099KT24_COLPS|nr:tRNA (adenine(22)-N(1))-methyltransferase TrmK [Colwellia psychrerythraea]KGJ93924.1 protein of unknown function DUF633 [Colwellia psychrerythraea]
MNISSTVRSKKTIKLGQRLQKIEQMVLAQQYSHIWDCCCDHGLLGAALLSRQVGTDTFDKVAVDNTSNNNSPSNIHFVDIVPELMVELDNKLQRFYPDKHLSPSSAWHTHCIDVTKLPLAQHHGNHLVIIAGVGGDLMIEFIEAIYQQHKNLSIDFLLCPVHHQFPLRNKLIELNFSLKDEVLVAENKRFYEILLVSSTSNKERKIHPVGDEIWRSTSITQAEIAAKYLTKTLNHYQRMQKGFQQSFQTDVQQEKANDLQAIINAYRAVTLSA